MRTSTAYHIQDSPSLGGQRMDDLESIRVNMIFVDRVTIFVKGGDGGAGCCSFRREKYVPKGGPNGGDGGDGGDVIVRAVAGTDSLADIVNRKHWRADAGGRGLHATCTGRKGSDLTLPLRPG